MTPAEKMAAEKGKSPKVIESRTGKTGYRCTLRERRTALGLSGQDVLDGIQHNGNAANIHQWEKDIYLPPFAVALKLTEFFGCTVEELWTKELPATVEVEACAAVACTQCEMAA